MLKTKEEYGADAEGINDAWDWAQQKVICLKRMFLPGINRVRTMIGSRKYYFFLV